jgi:CRP/FNR family transcriptional regulator, cyclic AMP receptor protein
MDNDAGPRPALLSGMSAEEAAAVAGLLTARHLAPGEVLFRQGTAGSSAFMLVEGSMAIVVDSQGAQHTLATLGPGAVIGETSLLLHTPHSATAMAVTETTLWEMTRDVLRAALDHGDSWAAQVLLAVGRELARRVQTVNEQLLALIAEARAANTVAHPESRVAELETLRGRLLSDWSF